MPRVRCSAPSFASACCLAWRSARCWLDGLARSAVRQGRGLCRDDETWKCLEGMEWEVVEKEVCIDAGIGDQDDWAGKALSRSVPYAAAVYGGTLDGLWAKLRVSLVCRRNGLCEQRCGVLTLRMLQRLRIIPLDGLVFRSGGWARIGECICLCPWAISSY